MIEIIHVSDLHIGKRTKDARRLLAKLEERFAFRDNPNRFLLVTGDITQDGSASQYKTADAALRCFAGRIFVVPGNHDYGYLGFIYSAKCARNFDRTLAKGLGMNHEFFPKIPYAGILGEGADAVLIVGLNSCSKTTLPFDIASGEIGPSQLDELNKILDRPKHRDLPKIVFLHHIPHRRAAGWGMTLQDHAALTGVVGGRVQALAYGHEGAMDNPEARSLLARSLKGPDATRLREMLKTPPPERPMRVRRAGTDKRCYRLNANRSVDEMSCYRISIDKGEVQASLIRLEEPAVRAVRRSISPRRRAPTAGAGKKAEPASKRRVTAGALRRSK